MTAITAVANSGKRYEFYSAFFARNYVWSVLPNLCWHVRLWPKADIS
jgi:hypothetical protein